ncbi:hypothetical protein HDU91_006429 [Kappamyces sp. JEL0680]|nr:hypothetical protein HDU91_006429 [Kappamyces sp. JEL0680]
MSEGPRLGQIGICIISQILEFWETSYFKEGLEDLQGASKEPSGKGQGSEDRPAASMAAGLYMGKSVHSKLKKDGAWNFQTILRKMSADSITFEAIFSRPTKQNPVPKATASVWFQITKKEDLACYEMLYWFEQAHQEHRLAVSADATKHGFSAAEKEALGKHASLLANPNKRLTEILHSKLAFSEQRLRWDAGCTSEGPSPFLQAV